MLKLILPLLFRVRRAMVYDLIRRQLADSLPFVRHCGITIDRLEDGRAIASLPERGELKNHIGSQHAGAVFTLAETASGAAMAGAMAPVLMTVRPVAAEARISYLKLGKGPLTAEARTEETGEALRDRLSAEGKVRFPVAIDIRDAAGDTVAAMTVDWYVSPKR